MLNQVSSSIYKLSQFDLILLGITSQELDNLLAETAAYLNMLHPDCGKLAARVAVTNLHKKTCDKFSDTIEKLYTYVDNGENASLIAKDVYDVIQNNKERLDSIIDYKRDWDYDFFGYKTLEKSYLLKVHGKICERPQQMIMRVAIGIHKTDIESAINTYEMISLKWFTHATPTLFNAGTPKP
jgi:ribonucleoside-diphosphate reductase alpha chain